MNTIPRYAAEALGPNVVLIRDLAVIDALYLVREGIKATNSNSANVPRFQRLYRELQRAYTMAADRHADVDSAVALQSSNMCEDSAAVITVADAATLLGLSERQALRLAPTLGRRVGGRWLIDRGAVLALKAQREQESYDAT